MVARGWSDAQKRAYVIADNQLALAPSLSRAVFLVNPNLTPSLPQRFAGAEAAGKSLGISQT